jgi:hypothetical protein
MSVQFEWQSGRDDGQWETIAQADRRRRFRWLRQVPVWGWVITLVALVALGAVGYVAAQRRYEEMHRQVEFQIQGVIDLEARAFAEGDMDLFLDQQDVTSPDWYEQQKLRVRPDCIARAAFLSVTEEEKARDTCAPVLPAKVQSVDLQGDVAWVEVIEGQHPVRRIRFYRQTDLGWKQTAPQPRFWKTAIRVQYGNLFIQYHKRDAPYVESLEEHIARTVASVCATTYCPAANTLVVDFSAESPVYASPYLVAEPASQGRDWLYVSSPWLAGIPANMSVDETDEGAWDGEYLDELTHAVASATAARAMRSVTKLDLNPLRRAVIDEYATWYSQRDTTQLPLLGPIIERGGTSALPQVLRSAKENGTWGPFVERWHSLSLDPDRAGREQAIAYFETVLNLEREALLAGRRETFLMLQDPSWRNVQARYYEQAQLQDLQGVQSPVRVLDAQVMDGHARVLVEEPLSLLRGQALQSKDNIVYFRVKDGDWGHANTLDSFFWTLKPSTPSFDGSSSPLPTSTPAPNRSS